MMTSERIPSPERIREIVAAVKHLLITANETYSISDQTLPTGFPEFDISVRMVEAISRLEQAMNPGRIPFGANGRKARGASGWPDGFKMMTALGWLSNLRDSIIVAWKMEAICEGKSWGWASGTQPPSTLPNNTVYVGNDWPPKIKREVIEGMISAAGQIAEVYRSAYSPPQIVDDNAEKTSSGLLAEAPAVTDQDQIDLRLEETIPSLDTNDEEHWITAIAASRELKSNTSTDALKTSRSRSRARYRHSKGTVGIDGKGRWWRQERNTQDIWYYMPSLSDDFEHRDAYPA